MADNLLTTTPNVATQKPIAVPVDRPSPAREKEYFEETEESDALFTDYGTDEGERSADSEEEDCVPVQDADDDIHTDPDIFEEDSDDESSLDSLSTTCYEELDYDAPLIRYVEPIFNDNPATSDDDKDFGSDVSNWSDELYESETTMGNADTPLASTDSPSYPPNGGQKTSTKEPLTFSDAERQRFELLSYKKDIEYEEARWELQAAEEELSSLLQKVSMLKNNVRELEEKKQDAEDKVTSSFQKCGISPELYAEYEAFCSSLNPRYGLRGGFTIETFRNHQGDYIQHDPDFVLFKESVKDEMPYNDRNFRVEAKSFDHRRDEVTFWPLKCPNPVTDEVKTWGGNYPDLYRLAIDAVREDKSEAAMEMLIRLPDMNAALGGGWLFDYQPEPTLADHPIVSMQWRFRSAHKIDSPVSVEGKRLRLQLMLQPEQIPEAAISDSLE